MSEFWQAIQNAAEDRGHYPAYSYRTVNLGILCALVCSSVHYGKGGGAGRHLPAGQVQARGRTWVGVSVAG